MQRVEAGMTKEESGQVSRREATQVDEAAIVEDVDLAALDAVPTTQLGQNRTMLLELDVNER